MNKKKLTWLFRNYINLPLKVHYKNILKKGKNVTHHKSNHAHTTTTKSSYNPKSRLLHQNFDQQKMSNNRLDISGPLWLIIPRARCAGASLEINKAPSIRLLRAWCRASSSTTILVDCASSYRSIERYCFGDKGFKAPAKSGSTSAPLHGLPNTK